MKWLYSRASGPGGQHVNKVDTKAELRLTLNFLPPELPTADIVVVRCDTHRSLQANKLECRQRAVEMIRARVAETVRPPTDAMQLRRMEAL
jgi:protein subunit release factor B